MKDVDLSVRRASQGDAQTNYVWKLCRWWSRNEWSWRTMVPRATTTQQERALQRLQSANLMARQGGQEVCTDRRYGSSAQKLVVAVVRLRTSLFAEVPHERAVAGVSREMHQGTKTANQFNKASLSPVFWKTAMPLRGSCLGPWPLSA